MADTKLAKVGITVKGPWKDDISFEVLDYALWMVQDGGDGCGYIAKRANIGVVPNSDDSVWIKATQAGQSIYDLAVKYGHFEGTEEEFEAEYQAALQAARVAASETSATNVEIQAAEELRKTAENGRVEAETARQTAETERQAAETARNTAETQRGGNETTRQSQEAARESAEQTRQTNESTRQSNETARESAEQERTADFEALKTDMETAIGRADDATAEAVALNNLVANDEAARQQAESGRVAAETARQSAEQTRAQNESTRQTQEAARQSAEQTRQTQEGTRQTQEAARQTAEGNRASAESQRVSNETARQTAETARETQATSDHERAEADHAIAEEDHSTLDEKIAHKADIDGSYDSMAVGLAKNLEGRSNVTDSFFKRTTGGDAEVANGTAQLNEVKGKSQVWNQLVGDDTESIVVVNGHKYLSVIGGVKAIGESDGNAIAVTGGTDMVIDLTLIFGEGNEPATVEEFEAWLAENIGEMPYYPYNAGEVLNNRMTGVESIGFNLLDPATGKADIIGAYSDVYGNYYGITGTHGALTFTDKLGNSETVTPDSDGKFLLEKAGELTVATPGEDCAVFLWWDGTQTEYKQYEKNVGALDVTHIYGKLNGTGDYVRVWPTGMPGIGDIKDTLKIVDGQVVAERKIGEVDMGTLSWVYESGNGQYQALLPSDWYHNPTTGFYLGCIASNMIIDNAMYMNMPERHMRGIHTNSRVYVVDGNYTDATLFTNSVSGVMLYSKLFASRVYTDLIYQNSELFADGTPVTLPVNYKVDNWGIERVIPQNTEEAVLTTKPELTMRYSIDAIEELNTHRDEINDLYEKNEELDERKPEKYGEYPDMAVGSAKTLAGQDTKVEDFVFKAIDCADGLAKLNSARGKSLVWNQLIQNGNFSDGTSGWIGVTSFADGVATTIKTATGNATTANVSRFPMPYIEGHKYLFNIGVKSNNIATSIALVPTGTASQGQTTYQVFSEWTSLKCIWTCPASPYRSLHVRGYNLTDPNTDIDFSIKTVRCFDLTLMFGAGNEPSTVEEFEKMFPLPYYDYNEGEIISNKTEEVKVVGFNQWDEEWEYGHIGYSGNNLGQPIPNNNTIRCKNYIPILPNTTYYLRYPTPHYIWYYDANKNCLRFPSSIQANSTFTTPDNARFAKIAMEPAYGRTYNHDICINISDPARNGTYEPYKTNTIELNLPTLTGKLNGEGESVVVFPDGLKSAGSVYDEIVGNRAIKRVGKRKIDGTESIILNTKNLEFEGANFTFVSNDLPIVANSDTVVRVISDKLNPLAGTRVDGSSSVSVISNKRFYLFATYATLGNGVSAESTNNELVAAMRIYLASINPVLYYELAEPEEYILDAPLPDTFQAYKGGTIKQLPENTSEPVTAPMVMTVTYAIDAVGTLVGLPRNYVSKESLQAMLNAMQSAGIIASYTMTYNENTGKYDFTFVAPTNS